MAQSVLEQMGVQIDETARKASRAASVLADALEAVSYTHLDVYKRQCLEDASVLFFLNTRRFAL